MTLEEKWKGDEDKEKVIAEISERYEKIRDAYAETFGKCDITIDVTRSPPRIIDIIVKDTVSEIDQNVLKRFSVDIVKFAKDFDKLLEVFIKDTAKAIGELYVQTLKVEVPKVDETIVAEPMDPEKEEDETYSDTE